MIHMLQRLYVVPIPKTEQLLSTQQNFTMPFIWRFETRKKNMTLFLLLCFGWNLFCLSYLSGVEDHLLSDYFLCILFISCFFADISVIYPLVRKIVTGSWVVHQTLQVRCHKCQVQSVQMKAADPPTSRILFDVRMYGLTEVYFELTWGNISTSSLTLASLEYIRTKWSQYLPLL